MVLKKKALRTSLFAGGGEPFPIKQALPLAASVRGDQIISDALELGSRFLTS